MGRARSGTVVVLALCGTAAVANDALQQWKEKDLAYQREAAVVAAEGKQAVDRGEVDAARARYLRLQRLADAHSISPIEARKAKEEKALAEIAVRDAEAERVLTVATRDLAAASKRCEAGETAGCVEAEEAYRAVFRARRVRVEAARDRAIEELDLENYQLAGLTKLVEDHALDPAVLDEERGHVRAREAAVAAAKAEIALLESTVR